MGLFTPSPEKKFEKAKKYYQQMKYSKAYELFSDVAHNSKGELNHQAVFHLAEMNRKGLGTQENHSLAASQYEHLARWGNVDAMRQISLYYIHGEGGKLRNFGEAFKWCGRAVESGETEAKNAWEQFYDPKYKDPVTGWETTLDSVEEAFQNYKPDQFIKNYPEDYDAFYPSVILCWLAAQDGSARAQRLLGDMFLRGLSVRTDWDEAHYWYEKAGEQRDMQACFCLGEMFAHGSEEYLEIEDALYWYEKAGELGNAQAYFYAAALKEASMVDDEYSVDALDSVICYYQKAADLGHKEAKELLETLTALRKACYDYYENGCDFELDETDHERTFKTLVNQYEAGLAASGRLAKFKP